MGLIERTHHTDGEVTLVPNDTEQAVIAKIRAWRAIGWTLKRIADELTNRNVPTKTERSARRSHQVIARIARRM
jgi:hypothetical protein